jgi:hypothetical protein
MDFPMAKKAKSETVLEIIQSLSVPSSEMVDLSCDVPANLTLNVFTQER